VGRLEDLRNRWEREPASRAFLPLAEEFRRLGRLADSERVCREGLQKHPHYHSARVLLARTLLEMDRLEESSTEFRAVLETEPQNLLAGKLLAGIYRSQGRWAEALETYRKLQSHYPDDAEVRTQVYQLERGPEEQTGPASQQPSPGATAQDALATNTLAEIYLRQGLVDRAVAVYENMLRADPDNQAVRRRIAEIQGSGEGRVALPAAQPVSPGSVMADPRRKVIQCLQHWLIGVQRG
jgi:tetratricopeptide (TPR) repeat protein